MVGNPGIPPVADAIVKGFDGIDYELAFEAMKTSALRPDRGQDHRMKYGYIPCDLFNESVAYDLEYALADGAIANAAEVLGKQDEMEFFRKRSLSYRELFDAEKGFIRGKDSKGKFRKEYSPFASTHRSDDYCEGNGWQYTWLVPHDFEGLVECFGSREDFVCKLDSLFAISSTIEGDDSSPDISGLIGQYAHGNEPSHHIIYLYTMAGEPWKAADKVREVAGTMYTSAPDGLSGNEDVGQMSAWYILSAMGFYQAEPGSGRYWFGSPLVDEAEITVEKGIFRVVVENNSDKDRYIQSVELNGKAYDKGYIEHKDIAAGGTLTFRMGTEKKIWY
jgi:predicted alpha-1,2-mannosidase